MRSDQSVCKVSDSDSEQVDYARLRICWQASVSCGVQQYDVTVCNNEGDTMYTKLVKVDPGNYMAGEQFILTTPSLFSAGQQLQVAVQAVGAMKVSPPLQVLVVVPDLTPLEAPLNLDVRCVAGGRCGN